MLTKTQVFRFVSAQIKSQTTVELCVCLISKACYTVWRCEAGYLALGELFLVLGT